MDDRELLDEFVKARSQSAFRELVERHLPVVYSAARRLVRDAHLAECHWRDRPAHALSPPSPHVRADRTDGLILQSDLRGPAITDALAEALGVK